MSSFKGGYTGRTLRVDLTAQTVTVEETPDVTRWLGPRGWQAKVAWEEVAPGVGPFDPENRIVFSAGPLVGTGAPTAGRITVSTLAPRGYPNPMWTWASMGGYLGSELKYAGYDSIIVQGQASSPCYLLIEDDKVFLRDASDLWGQGVYATEIALKKRHSQQHQVLGIGPAGENRVRFASIIHRLNNAVGNGGFGGVMGAKGLKAIAVRGTRGVALADPRAYVEAVNYVWNQVKSGFFRVGGPDTGYPNIACTHGCSVRCMTGVRPLEDRYQTGAQLAMRTCNEGQWAYGAHNAYQGVSATGQKLDLQTSPGMGQLGMDLLNLVESEGMTIWCYRTFSGYFWHLKSLGINEVLGEPLDLENPEWWHKWILDVSHRRGLGGECAEGLSRFYDKYQLGEQYVKDFFESRGSRGHGWHREGRLMERHPSPFWEHAALLYAVSTRDATPSTHGFLFLTYSAKPEDGTGEPPIKLQKLAEQLYGSARAVFPGDEFIEHVTAWHQHRSVIKDSMTVCDWVFPVLRRTFESLEDLDDPNQPLAGDLGAEAVLYRAATGIDMSIEEMESPIAERIVNLERCIDIRNCGRTRELDEAVIPHFQWPEKTDGTHLSATGDEFRSLLERFYELRGWDKRTGWPTTQTLVDLGMPQVAEEMSQLCRRIEEPMGEPVLVGRV